MKINHNIPALKANNQLNKSDNAMAKTLEKLTSGFKINHASDDPAGMAISRKMKAQIKGLDKASSNASDGISVIQTAEGALEEVSSCLQRMNELAVQAANGTYSTEDRRAIQLEIDQLNEEIQRISDTTEFNTKKLLDGSVDRKSYTDSLDVKIISIADEVTSSDKYKITIEEDARQAVIVAHEIDQTLKATDKIFGDDYLENDKTAAITVNGETVLINEDDTCNEVYEKIRDLCSSIDINCFVTDVEVKKDVNGDIISDPDTKAPALKLVSAGNGDFGSAGYEVGELGNINKVKYPDAKHQSLVFVSELYGSNQEVTVSCNNEYIAKKLGLYSKLDDKGVVAVKEMNAVGVDAQVKIPDGIENAFAKTATVFSDGRNVRVTDLSGFEIKVEIEPGAVKTKFADKVGGGDVDYTQDDTQDVDKNGNIYSNNKYVNLTVLEAGEMSLHIGANAYQTMKVTIPEVTPKTLGVDIVNIRTKSGAEKSIDMIGDAIIKLSTIRAKLGAYENRLEHAISNLDTSNENLTESLSRIEDTDMAKEMATYTQYNVLVQASTSMLAQANERPQNVLSLLQ